MKLKLEHKPIMSEYGKNAVYKEFINLCSYVIAEFDDGTTHLFKNLFSNNNRIGFDYTLQEPNIIKKVRFYDNNGNELLYWECWLTVCLTDKVAIDITLD